MKDCDLGRRDLLRQLGVGTACLPLLWSSRVWAAAGAAPRRLMIVPITNGYRQQLWRPMNGSLMNQALPDSSSPLEPHKADLVFLPGMTHPSYPGRNQHGAYPNHLTAGPNSGKGEYRVAHSPSVDQVVGAAVAKTANVSRPALNLGIQIDQGFSGEGFNSKRCIFRGMNEPINPEQNPYKTYADIFGGAGDRGPTVDAAAKRLFAHRKSILDFVGRDLERFRDQVGPEDRAAIGGHLQSIRDLERQLDGSQTSGSTGAGGTAACGGNPGMPVSHTDPRNYPTLVKVNMDLMIAALRCDVTRVTTLQMADATGANLPWSFLPGIPELGTGFHSAKRNWHDIGHNPVMGGVDHKRMVDKWCMVQFADLLTRMKAVVEPGGTLLDSSVVLLTNCMEDGANHDTQKIPWILAGKCGGFFKTGFCAESAGKPLNGVLTDVCNAMGVPVEYFGDPGFGKSWAGLRA